MLNKEECVKELLYAYRLSGENFEDTPRRFIATLDNLIFRERPKMTTFLVKGKPGMLFIKNYVTWSLCPHHLLPVKYTFKIGYIPEDIVLGLSKLARIADWVMSQLPLQEEIPGMICDFLQEVLNPKGCGVLVQGEHLCMRMRGVQSENTTAISSGLRGVMLTEPSAKEEFLLL